MPCLDKVNLYKRTVKKEGIVAKVFLRLYKQSNTHTKKERGQYPSKANERDYLIKDLLYGFKQYISIDTINTARAGNGQSRAGNGHSCVGNGRSHAAKI